MLTDSLIGHIDNAVAQAGFADVYKNRLNASHVRHLYEGKQRCPFSSTDAITVPRPELCQHSEKAIIRAEREI